MIREDYKTCTRHDDATQSHGKYHKQIAQQKNQNTFQNGSYREKYGNLWCPECWWTSSRLQRPSSKRLPKTQKTNNKYDPPSGPSHNKRVNAFFSRVLRDYLTMQRVDFCTLWGCDAMTLYLRERIVGRVQRGSGGWAQCVVCVARPALI